MITELLNFLGSIILLTLLELILSIDNILFINFACAKLNGKVKIFAKQIGILLAIIGRIALLFSINWLTKFNKPLFYIKNFAVSVKDIVMLIGGLYLVYFALIEIFKKHNTSASNKVNTLSSGSFLRIFIAIIFFDTLCSFDSVLTAVAIGYNLAAMIISIILACIVLAFSVNPISNFIDKHPNIKLLALSFLLLIGITLIGNSFHYYISELQILLCVIFAAFVQFITVKKNNKNKDT